LTKGPAKIRVLSREELKIEIKKYKNISLKIIADFKKLNQKVPGYANNLVKEAGLSASQQLGEGLAREKSETNNFDGSSSMFDAASEFPEDDVPDRYK